MHPLSMKTLLCPPLKRLMSLRISTGTLHLKAMAIVGLTFTLPKHFAKSCETRPRDIPRRIICKSSHKSRGGPSNNLWLENSRELHHDLSDKHSCPKTPAYTCHTDWPLTLSSLGTSDVVQSMSNARSGEAGSCRRS